MVKRQLPLLVLSAASASAFPAVYSTVPLPLWDAPLVGLRRASEWGARCCRSRPTLPSVLGLAGRDEFSGELRAVPQVASPNTPDVQIGSGVKSDPDAVPLKLPLPPGAPNPNGRPPSPDEQNEEASESFNMIVKLKGDPAEILRKLEKAGLMKEAVRDTVSDLRDEKVLTDFLTHTCSLSLFITSHAP